MIDRDTTPAIHKASVASLNYLSLCFQNRRHHFLQVSFLPQLTGCVIGGLISMLV